MGAFSYELIEGIFVLKNYKRIQGGESDADMNLCYCANVYG